MKLVFSKEENEIKVKLLHNGTEEDFNYIKLIKFIHEDNELEETSYSEEITPEEREKVNVMISKINEVIIRQSEASVE
ncbi:MAG: hypothetical protein PHW18_12435 [Sulfuricurvum sp.]|uniref:hypothetical protein n=1 Tax=Sulfuricurvum sp. TaxID=2025608 RepID=UPI00261248F7|nr:hypothetical protein [Sulfuricurvum sp.]MDD2830374.1 hypothetical protein [Sulfuricurvum sp.]MDD4950295.1 hypothetical protein [Sulfuricurvum sp.]